MNVISKEIEFDAGHRVPAHASKCRNPHGHRYKLVVYCQGEIIDEPGAPDEGMLIDFGDLKGFMTELIHDVLDHGFIVYEDDLDMLTALEGHGWKVIVFPLIPTAENLARWCWDQLEPIIASHFRGNLTLAQIAIHETPTSVAWYTGPEVDGDE